jgi:hypothetical protein
MRRLLTTVVTATAAAALAPSAFAAPGAVRVVELDPGGGGERVSTSRYTLVGLHWQGPGTLRFRTRSLEGRWRPWRMAAPEAGDGPDATSPEAARRRGWRIGNPWWAGPSDALQVRASGRVARMRAHLVWSPGALVPYRTPAATSTPQIVRRLSWGADESIRRGPPTYAPAVRFAVVHHTAGQNDYSRAEAPAVVKAIQLYHVRGNGWNDIGYNFLVDRFGTIYEGRFGGIDRNVVGAHALGFNSGSVGIALLGTYGGGAPSRAAQEALVRLLAWRLDVAHVDATSSATVVSGGSERYASGLPVLMRAVSGHRDSGLTECPGDALYAKLDALAASAEALGLPKVYEPRVEARGKVFRFRARLSGPLAWSVSIADADGTEVARGAGTGASVDWSWDSTAAAPGRYTWSIAAGGARSATGSIRAGGAATPAVENVSVEPASITPNGDGQADTALVSYRITTPMNVTIEVADSLGAVVTTVVDRVWTQAGTHEVAVDGGVLPDGSYTVAVRGRTATGGELQVAVPLSVSRALGLVTVSPAAFSPNGDGRRDLLRIALTLAAPAEVRVRVFRERRGVAVLLASSLEAGSHELTWNGLRASGAVRDGDLTAVVEARDAVGWALVSLPFVSDTAPPRVDVLPGRPLRVRVSEPALLVLRVDGSTLRHEAVRAGVVRVPWSGEARRVRVVAWDEAGNRSAPAGRVARPGSSGPRE